jgi:hypothetical protein
LTELKGKTISSLTLSLSYSCSDINILVRDAAFEPIRKAQNATHFKIIGYTLEGKPVYQPTIPTDPQAREIRMLDIPGSQLQLPPVSVVSVK